MVRLSAARDTRFGSKASEGWDKKCVNQQMFAKSNRIIQTVQARKSPDNVSLKKRRGGKGIDKFAFFVNIYKKCRHFWFGAFVDRITIK